MAMLGVSNDRLDGPPPNPVTSPAAAQESSPIKTLTGGIPPGGPNAPGAPGPGLQQGPDLTGILGLYEKLTEGMLALAQACPAQAGMIDTARAMLENAAANFAQAQSTQSSAMGVNQSSTPPPGVVSQAGPQFPGGGFGAGRAF